MTTLTTAPALAYPCPFEFCGAQAGEPCMKTVRSGRRMPKPDFHTVRIRKARAEDAGPQPFDVVYLDGLKYRVALVEPLQLRRGTSKTLLWGITRDMLGYDPIAGMWRKVVEA